MYRFAFLTSVCALALFGCSSDKSDVTIEFEGLVAGQKAECGRTYEGIGTSESAFSLEDFRLFVHDVRVVTADGREVPVALEQDGRWQHEDVALLDFETGGSACPAGNAETNTRLRGTVPEAGPFVGLRFTVGVPFELNHEDVTLAPPPLNTSAMFWSWQSGYKFVRIDGRTDEGAPFFFHLGSTGCDGDPLVGGVTACARPNRVEVRIEEFDPEQEKLEVDLAALFAGNDLASDEADPGCMSDPEDPDCAPIFERLGLDLGGASAQGEQRVFSASSK